MAAICSLGLPAVQASDAEADGLSEHLLEMCLVDAKGFPIVPVSSNQSRL